MQLERHERVMIHDVAASSFIDQAAQHIMYCYILKLHETVKWRKRWDDYDVGNKMEMAAKGLQRAGPGKGTCWDYAKDSGPPTYCPESINQTIDVQIAELLTFATRACNVPEAFWLNESEQGQAAKRSENVPSCIGDYRSTLLLRLVRALYGKPSRSFIASKIPCLFYTSAPAEEEDSMT